MAPNILYLIYSSRSVKMNTSGSNATELCGDTVFARDNSVLNQCFGLSVHPSKWDLAVRRIRRPFGFKKNSHTIQAHPQAPLRGLGGTYDLRGCVAKSLQATRQHQHSEPLKLLKTVNG